MSQIFGEVFAILFFILFQKGSIYSQIPITHSDAKQEKHFQLEN